jgi:hypothetical protein
VFTRTDNTWTQQAKLHAIDAEEGDNFGYSVSLDGDTAIIGAYYDDDNDLNSGSAYVFTRSNAIWTQQSKLLASDGTPEDNFGTAVSLDGDTALIGAPYKNEGSYLSQGSVYVFTRTDTTWTQEAKLLSSDGQQNDQFGRRVSLSGDTALIASWWDDDYDSNTGSAYVFTRIDNTWTQQQKLVASDPTLDDNFGVSVSLDGDTAFIGSWMDDDKGSDSGSVYIFLRSGTTWTEQCKLHASDGTMQDYFGFAISLDGDTAIIGAWGDDDGSRTFGSAYVFTRTDNIWTQQQKLLPSDGYDGNFGYSLSLDGDTALIAAPYDDDLGAYSGSVYVFAKEEDENHPPLTPIITGPAKGKIKVAIEYNFTTTDPDGDEISYFIDWGDETNSGWIGPYTSGEAITESHTWSKKGDYIIKAKAKDIYGNESDWGELSVNMPFSYNVPLKVLWERIFEWFPNAFLIIRHLMGY